MSGITITGSVTINQGVSLGGTPPGPGPSPGTNTNPNESEIILFDLK